MLTMLGSSWPEATPSLASNKTANAGFATPPTTSAMMVCIGPMPSLAAAKAYLARRAQFAVLLTDARRGNAALTSGAPSARLRPCYP